MMVRDDEATAVSWPSHSGATDLAFSVKHFPELMTWRQVALSRQNRGNIIIIETKKSVSVRLGPMKARNVIFWRRCYGAQVTLQAEGEISILTYIPSPHCALNFNASYTSSRCELVAGCGSSHIASALVSSRYQNVPLALWTKVLFTYHHLARKSSKAKEQMVKEDGILMELPPHLWS